MKYKLLLGLILLPQFIFASDDPDYQYYENIRANFARGSGGNGCGPCGLAYQAAYNDGNEAVAKHFLKEYIKQHGRKLEYGVQLYSEDIIQENLPKQTSNKHKKSDKTESGEILKLCKQDKYEESRESSLEKVIYRQLITEEETRIFRRIVEEFTRVQKKGD